MSASTFPKLHAFSILDGKTVRENLYERTRSGKIKWKRSYKLGSIIGREYFYMIEDNSNSEKAYFAYNKKSYYSAFEYTSFDGIHNIIESSQINMFDKLNDRLYKEIIKSLVK